MVFVIIDTNFFLLPYTHKVDILNQISSLVAGEIEFVVSTQLLKELQSLKHSGVPLAMKFISQLKDEGRLTVKDSNMFVDGWIIKFVKENPATVVCTNDAELRKDLKKIGCKIIALRTNKRINFV